MYDNLIIFYFTGTGNALAASNWIASVAKELNVRCTIVKITPSLKVNTNDFSKNSLIGFCYPTHGFNAPPVVINFFLRFPGIRNKAFVLNTRAGMKISKLFTPGLSGFAQIIPSLILKTKGLRIIGMQPLDLPSNWISVHPGIKPKVVESIFQRCEKITKKVAKRILQGETTYKGLLSLPFDIAISPISIAYYFFGRFALAKTFIADHTCNSCSLCQKECSARAILMKNKRPFWTNKCESCMHCMNICPQRAIQTPQLFTVVLWWMVFSVIPAFALKELAQSTLAYSKYYNLAFNLFILITGLPIIFFSYRILHWLMKFRFFNWLITYTSLTKF
ncbi:MAG: EFR1 family ferrodoxin, partial [Draconibacterium sp.]|nr:EFR1 family ferrodoxin [Draconibacterium sp.]